MKLENKSIEELRECNAKITQELKQKEDERILNDGGFRCKVCKKTFPADHVSVYYPEICNSCGFERRRADESAEYAMLETAITRLSAEPSEIVHLRFGRDWRKMVDLDSTYSTERSPERHQYAAVVRSFVLKVGDKYLDVHSNYDEHDEEVNARINITIHNKLPTIEKDGYCRWDD